MQLEYTHLQIFTNEEAKFHKRPLFDAIVEYINGLNSAMRCMVTKGCGGCYEGGDVVTQNILALSMNMPIKIDIIGPSMEIEPILPHLEEMLSEGIILKQQKDLYFHRAQHRLLPRNLRVKDIMTRNPQAVSPLVTTEEIVKLLVDAPFSGLPVIDNQKHPIGIITSSDLVRKANLPLRLGLVSVPENETMAHILESLKETTAEKIMSSPVICIKADLLTQEAIQLMIRKSIKRLPVVAESGEITGMLSRFDIFKTISQTSPIWQKLSQQKLDIANLKFVSQVIQRDSRTVTPETRVEEVLHIFATHHIQRIAIVDENNCFIGMVSDRDLLYAFCESKGALWKIIANKLFASESPPCIKIRGSEMMERPVAEIMQTEIITVNEDTPLDHVIQRMAEKSLKRIPVVDGDMKFKGMVSRDSLLRAGFTH